MAPFYDGLSTLQEHMRFAGAPFEVPLPRSRWSRVIAKQGSDGTVFYAHVDITELKRQQRLLAQAERSARDSGWCLTLKFGRRRAVRPASSCTDRAFSTLEQGSGSPSLRCSKHDRRHQRPSQG